MVFLLILELLLFPKINGESNCKDGYVMKMERNDINDDDMSDIGRWLTQQRLSKYIGKFERDGISLYDLKLLENDQIKQFCKRDYGMNVVEENRFMDGISQLKLNDLFMSSEDVTENEEDAFVELNDLVIELNGYIDEIKNRQELSDNEMERCYGDVNKAFDSLISHINMRRYGVLSKLEKIKNARKMKLKQYLNAFSEYKNNVIQAKKQVSKLFLDENVDTTKRERTVMDITNKYVDNKNIHDKQNELNNDRHVGYDSLKYIEFIYQDDFKQIIEVCLYIKMIWLCHDIFFYYVFY